MGRPFILYDDDDDDCSGTCCDADLAAISRYPTFRDWQEAAIKVLQDCRIDSSSPEVTEILTYLYSTRRIAFLPNCEPVSGELGLLDSKIGGIPYLLPNEHWPRNNGMGLCHIWQQRINELPIAVQRVLGHSRGLLQVFLSETLDEEDGDWFRVRVLTEDQLVAPPSTSMTPELEAMVLNELRVASFSAEVDFPCAEDALDKLPAGLDRGLAVDVLDALQGSGVYETLSGDKLLGWPNWCLGPDWRRCSDGRRYQQVVQVEGSVVPFEVGSGGTLLLQRHPSERDTWEISWACT